MIVLLLLGALVIGWYLGYRFALSAAKEFARRLAFVMKRAGWPEDRIEILFNQVKYVDSKELENDIRKAAAKP